MESIDSAFNNEGLETEGIIESASTLIEDFEDDGPSYLGVRKIEDRFYSGPTSIKYWM